jgi:DNA adenine methylase
MHGDGTNHACLPFLKWAGGKRWLVRHCSGFIPGTYNTYLEPFLGSGAMFFALRPKRAILSDLNKDLIDTYRAISKDPDSVSAALRKHQCLHSKRHYYRVRSSRPRTVACKAARLIYLNRTCWNGLYRVNTRGQFNVPIGTKTSVCLPTDDFAQTRTLLSTASLIASDFERVIDMAGRRDLLFVDPPYGTVSNASSFAKYHQKLFGWSDQIRLRDCLKRAKQRGAFVVATNVDHASVRNLYAKDFRITSLQRASVIASDPRHRQATRELLITGHEVR